VSHLIRPAERIQPTPERRQNRVSDSFRHTKQIRITPSPDSVACRISPPKPVGCASAMVRRAIAGQSARPVERTIPDATAKDLRARSPDSVQPQFPRTPQSTPQNRRAHGTGGPGPGPPSTRRSSVPAVKPAVPTTRAPARARRQPAVYPFPPSNPQCPRLRPRPGPAVNPPFIRSRRQPVVSVRRFSLIRPRATCRSSRARQRSHRPAP
jgi:hypothetical protein